MHRHHHHHHHHHHHRHRHHHYRNPHHCNYRDHQHHRCSGRYLLIFNFINFFLRDLSRLPEFQRIMHDRTLKQHFVTSEWLSQSVETGRLLQERAFTPGRGTPPVPQDVSRRTTHPSWPPLSVSRFPTGRAPYPTPAAGLRARWEKKCCHLISTLFSWKELHSWHFF